MIAMHVVVTTEISKVPIATLGGRAATFEEYLRMPIRPPIRPPAVRSTPITPSARAAAVTTSNRYKGINPDGKAEARVAVEEKLSGPRDTYSSVTVRVEVAVHCDQSEEAINTARDILFKEGLKALDHYADPLYEQLLRHLGKLGG